MSVRVIQGDAIEEMRRLPDNSVDLIATDPPYYRVKGEAWDRQWDKPEAFLAWLGECCREWHRLLRPNGSLYVFASPRMAARVECLIGETFNVVNRITWRKPAFSTKAEMFRKGDLRSFFPASEAVIFAEHKGAESWAKGEAGHEAKCDELRGFVFEPLRAWFVAERDRLGLTNKAVNKILGTATNGSGMAGHYFKPSGAVQWELPTSEHYEKIQRTGGFRRSYEDLRREYEDLRGEYEELRRPFAVTADVPYTDVWDFPTVGHYHGKHPCEKPLALMRHIVRASSRPGGKILDCFAGSGTTGVAAMVEGRDAILIERDGRWCERIERRIEQASAPLLMAAE